MPTITGHLASADRYVTDLTTDSGHALLADEPLIDGGENMGPSPGELLAAALTACTCITVRMYATRKGWPLREVRTEVSFERPPDHVVRHLTRQLHLLGELTPEQRQRLLQVANACPVHKALTGGVSVDTQLGGEPAGI
ncbi:OsmC family peroxiredoxin [Hymenobacter gummosus]|uniref:OsmC family peroxiredoxin n=1 Tax=Hymenobacter gummosus TaxID=1776032 RepID=A0A3S0H6E6_9BACT|nr:OsmC family protein [Hymenobacter gummosus]RTQ50881.1 OsmC family peroxiredoxin [Hymenobacter gummosus]